MSNPVQKGNETEKEALARRNQMQTRSGLRQEKESYVQEPDMLLDWSGVYVPSPKLQEKLKECQKDWLRYYAKFQVHPAPPAGPDEKKPVHEILSYADYEGEQEQLNVKKPPAPLKEPKIKTPKVKKPKYRDSTDSDDLDLREALEYEKKERKDQSCKTLTDDEDEDEWDEEAEEEEDDAY